MPYNFPKDDELTLGPTPGRSIECLTPVHADSADTRNLFTSEYYAQFPNRWCRIRGFIREPAAEFFGVLMMLLIGAGVDAQVVLAADPKVAPSPKGDWLALSVSWACAVAMGMWLSAGSSGGHLNPAITIAFATFRGFPWRKVPVYILAQLMGGLCGAGIAYGNYIHGIDIYEGGRNVRTVPGTAGLFSTYPLEYMTDTSCFFDEFIGTIVLLLLVCALTDPRNGPYPKGYLPFAMFITILAISLGLGMQTGYAINPARDLGPRILTAMVGYGKDVFTFRNQYWVWATVTAPILGALVGTFIYDLFFYTGPESPLNRPSIEARKIYLCSQQKSSVVAGAEAV